MLFTCAVRDAGRATTNSGWKALTLMNCT